MIEIKGKGKCTTSYTKPQPQSDAICTGMSAQNGGGLDYTPTGLSS